MIRGKCPTCGKGFEVERPGDLPAFPFCSDRCRLIDLGRWADGSHTIPGPAAPAGTTTPIPSMDDEGDE